MYRRDIKHRYKLFDVYPPFVYRSLVRDEDCSFTTVGSTEPPIV